jgi:hypothetical protein
MKNVGVNIEDVAVQRVKIDQKLVDAIVYEQRLDEGYVTRILRYNVIPIRAYAKITGTSINNIHQKLRGYTKSDGEITFRLNSCTPFEDVHEKFIFRNPKAQLFIEKKNDYKQVLEG